MRSPCCEGALRRPSVGHHEHLRSGEEEKDLTLEIVRSLKQPRAVVAVSENQPHAEELQPKAFKPQRREDRRDPIKKTTSECCEAFGVRAFSRRFGRVFA